MNNNYLYKQLFLILNNSKLYVTHQNNIYFFINNLIPLWMHLSEYDKTEG